MIKWVGVSFYGHANTDSDLQLMQEPNEINVERQGVILKRSM